MVRDALHKAVLDFEETLQRSHPKQITYTAIPDSPGHDAAVDITETGKSPSLSTILLCKCFAVLQIYAVCGLSCVVDGNVLAPCDNVGIFVKALMKMLIALRKFRDLLFL
jgi:hypothetical protein